MSEINADVNNDGTVDYHDVNEEIGALLQGDKRPEYDVNKDGRIDIGDVADVIDASIQPASWDGKTTVNGVSFKMIPVKPGTFTMGSPSTETGSGTNERPQHEVTLTKEYYIGETQVTQALWIAVMGVNPSSHKGNKDLPVEHVSYIECQAFIAKLNEITGKKFRLPTEAEWEFAARGGTLSKGFIFAGSNTPKDVAWYSSNSNGETQPVGQKQPNELGIYDMSGNVSEWCQDIYGAYPATEQTDPTGPATGKFKVYRNGSFQDVAKECRNARRYPAETTYKQPFLGLRLAINGAENKEKPKK